MWRRVCLADDRGNAIVEFVFVAVLLLVPSVYVLVSVAQYVNSKQAVTTAAREAGRAFATGITTADANARMAAAVRLALRDHGLDTDDVQVKAVAAGANCEAPAVFPAPQPGLVFTICVGRNQSLYGVPGFLDGGGVGTLGSFTVHIDDYRAASP